MNNQVTAHILWVFKKQWQHIKDTQSDIAVSTLVRLLKASGHPDLEGLHVVPAGSTIDLNGKRHVVVGAGPARFEALSKAPFMNQRPDSAAMQNAPAGRNRIYSRDAAGPVPTAPATGKGAYTDQPPKMTRKQWYGIWGESKKSDEGIYKARTSLVVMPAQSRYAVNYFSGRINSVSKTALNLAAKTLPPVIAVLEMVNFGRASTAFFKDALEDEAELEQAAITFLRRGGLRTENATIDLSRTDY